MTFWPLTSYSYIPTSQTFHHFHDLDTELDIHQITSGFHEVFATGVAFQQGLLTLPGSVPLFGTCLCSNCWDKFPELVVSFLDFSPWIPFGTFSIFLLQMKGWVGWIMAPILLAPNCDRYHDVWNTVKMINIFSILMYSLMSLISVLFWPGFSQRLMPAFVVTLICARTILYIFVLWPITMLLQNCPEVNCAGD